MLPYRTSVQPLPATDSAPHREDAVRRAMHQVKNFKNVTFADKENVDAEMHQRIKIFKD